MNFWLKSDTLTNYKHTKWYKSHHCINKKQNHHHHWINNKQNLTAMKRLLRCFISCVLLGIVFSCPPRKKKGFGDYSGPTSRGGKYFLIETEDSKYFLHWMMTWLNTKQAGLCKYMYGPTFVKYFKSFHKRSYIYCVILLM